MTNGGEKKRFQVKGFISVNANSVFDLGTLRRSTPTNNENDTQSMQKINFTYIRSTWNAENHLLMNTATLNTVVHPSQSVSRGVKSAGKRNETSRDDNNNSKTFIKEIG